MIFLWGANARENHPIFFHHVLKGIHNGAKLYVMDPRRTTSAQWADQWLGLNVGTDIALSNAMAREIIHSGLANETFIRRATTGFDAYRASVEPYTLEVARAGDRRSGRGHPRGGPRLRPRRPGGDLLDARHHRAPQRGRQRPVADQPGAAHRARRAIRLAA